MFFGAGMSKTTITNCKNYGNITYISGEYLAYAGAGGLGGLIVGEENKIENCCNEGEIKGVYHCGGIIGTGSFITINTCENIGKVSATGNYGSGGIMGSYRSEIVNIINCSNKAVIGEKSEGRAGGIVGIFGGCNYNEKFTLNIFNCYNKGRVTSKQYCGGILGMQSLTASTIDLNIQNCYSTGNINGTYSGGICGRLTASDSRTTATQTVKNAYYLDTTASKSVYSGTWTKEENILALSAEYMKSEDFLNDLNNNTQWATWKKGEDGYPVFE